jgi:X-Pro dipeptidyl-peptidase
MLAGLLGAPAGAQEELQTVQGLSQPIYGEWVYDEYRVPTDHGTIYGIVERPVVPEGVTVPIILTYSPYNTQNRPANGAEALSDHLDGVASYYVPRGYARARFDLVGTRESGGCPDFGGIAERETGAAIVDYLGEQPWSNGRVGMVGGSYDGTTQIAAAIEQPEHLVTIVPQVAIDRWYDYPYDGGVRRLSGYGTPLAFDYAFGMTPPTGIDQPTHVAEAAAARINPCQRVENQVRGYGWDPIYDAFWDERDYRVHADKVQASVLVEGGWLDTNVQPVGSVYFWQALPDDHPKKLVMGQWGHGTPDSTLDDWAGVRHAWFDYWLLGYDGTGELPDTGVMDLPRVDSHINTDERFQTDDWPGEAVTEATLDLSSFTLSQADSTWRSADSAVRGTAGSCDENSCVTLLSEPMTADTRIAGAPLLDVAVTTESVSEYDLALSTQIVVRLQEVGGEGATIATGMLNSRSREGERLSVDTAPGETWTGTVELDITDHVVAEGSALRLTISSHQVGPGITPDDDTRVTNTLELADGASALRLPLLPYDGAAAGAGLPTDAPDLRLLPTRGLVTPR